LRQVLLSQKLNDKPQCNNVATLVVDLVEAEQKE
jgi:hypothetical protein